MVKSECLNSVIGKFIVVEKADVKNYYKVYLLKNSDGTCPACDYLKSEDSISNQNAWMVHTVSNDAGVYGSSAPLLKKIAACLKESLHTDGEKTPLLCYLDIIDYELQKMTLDEELQLASRNSQKARKCIGDNNGLIDEDSMDYVLSMLVILDNKL